MGLEVASYIADLVATNPLSSDQVGQGDDHLRLLKTTLQATFPNLGNRYSRIISGAAGYTVLSSDNTAMISVPEAAGATLTHTVSLPALSSITAGFYVDLRMVSNSDLALVYPTGGASIEGAAVVSIGPHSFARIFYDGTTWKVNQSPLTDGATNQYHFPGPVSISGGLTLGSTLTVSGTVRVGGNLSVVGTAAIGSLFSVLGNTTLDAAVQINGDLSVSGSVYIGNTLSVSGAAHFASTVSVAGATTLGGAVTISGVATMLGAVTISGAATFHTTMSVSGAAHFKTTTSFGGAATMASTLTVSGAAVFHTTMSVSGAAHFKTTTSFGGAATMASTLTVSGTVALLSLLDLRAGQIKFPAAQNASADANTLDDYEEGGWTPVVTFDTPGDLNVVYSTQTGSYTKKGREVTVTGEIVTSTFTHTTASGSLRITGIPIAESTGFIVFSCDLGTLEGCTGLAATSAVAALLDSSSILFLVNIQNDGTAVDTSHAVTAVQKTIRFTAVYHV